MIGSRGRDPRRPAPPSVPLYEDVAWSEPHEVALPLWRKVLSGAELVALVALLGVALTLAVGVVLVVAFFLVDMLVG